jgi:hypothetical protein
MGGALTGAAHLQLPLHWRLRWVPHAPAKALAAAADPLVMVVVVLLLLAAAALLLLML